MKEICAICQMQLLTSQDIHVCNICEIKYHLECWNEINGCATFQCPNNPVVYDSDNENQEERQKGNKICPMCGESIDIYLKNCPFCNEQFDTTAPVSQDEIRKKYVVNDIKIPETKTAVWIFMLALLGITAPLILIFGLNWYVANKNKLIRYSPHHNLLMIISFIISGFYIVLFVLAIMLNS